MPTTEDAIIVEPAPPVARSVRTRPEESRARATLLTSLFRYLNDQNVPYCAVGDVGGLSQRVESDVDLVVGPGMMRRIPDVLSSFCAVHGTHLVQAIWHEQTAIFFVIAWKGTADELLLLQLDICGDYMREGRLLLGADLMLMGRYRPEDEHGEPEAFFVPRASSGFMYYLLKKVEKQRLHDCHGVYLSDRWHADAERAQMLVQNTWPEALSKIIMAAARTNRWHVVRAVLPELRAALHRQKRISLRLRTGEAARKVRRIRNPAGLMVAFYGPDGSGKSTVIDRVATDLLPAFWHSEWIHLRPGLGIRSRRSVPVDDPHGQPPRNPLASAAKLLYYVLDYVVGYALSVFPSRAKATMVIFDRYYHDLLVDPIRYRYSGPAWLIRGFARIIPDPDLSVFLDAPPDVLQRRKQEVSFSECERQRHAYLVLASRIAHSRVVDASRPLSEVVAAAEDAILLEMEERVRGRFQSQGALA